MIPGLPRPSFTLVWLHQLRLLLAAAAADHNDRDVVFAGIDVRHIVVGDCREIGARDSDGSFLLELAQSALLF